MSISGPITAEKTLFLGPRIPNHVKLLSKHLSTIKKPVFRSLIKLVVLDFEGGDVTPEMYQSIKDAAEDSSNIDSIYAALYTLLKCALSIPESSLKQDVFKSDLHELKLPDYCIDDLTSIVYGSRRSAIEATAIKNAPQIPKLNKFRWRVDVAISTSALNRVLEPAIVMEMELSDGKKETFEVHPSQFHRLRFAVATLLKEMENVEKRAIQKL